ncbi:MAG: exodeoxyribonuclease III [Pseudomonadota bacterium]
MKLITWNVNSVRVRLPRLLALLARHEPDVVCLQETKVQDEDFPRSEIEAAQYQVESFGQKAYNGVAILSKKAIKGLELGFEGNPVPEQARVISAEVAGVRIVNIYVVNGEEVGTEKFDLKLRWLDALRTWLERKHDPEQPLVMLGDFNIAPADLDVYDPEKWRGRVLFSEPEHQRLKTLLDWGLIDLLRVRDPVGVHYSWWDYRHGAFQRNWGLRIDLILGTQDIAKCCEKVEIDRAERKATTGEGKPSDHAPVIALLG